MEDNVILFYDSHIDTFLNWLSGNNDYYGILELWNANRYNDVSDFICNHFRIKYNGATYGLNTLSPNLWYNQTKATLNNVSCLYFSLTELITNNNYNRFIHDLSNNSVIQASNVGIDTYTTSRSLTDTTGSTNPDHFLHYNSSQSFIRTANPTIDIFTNFASINSNLHNPIDNTHVLIEPAPQPEPALTYSFNNSGFIQLYIKGVGGSGGSGSNNPAKETFGTYIEGVITLGKPTDASGITLYVIVGDIGESGVNYDLNNTPTLGGFGGGGNGGVNQAKNRRGGGGGGATSITTANGYINELSLEQILFVAAGGGGNGSGSGGGEGGSNSDGETITNSNPLSGIGGKKGTLTQGGIGDPYVPDNKGNGQYGLGGNGLDILDNAEPHVGGGGGGGLYGGGSGSRSNDGNTGSGGGGSGYSWINPNYGTITHIGPGELVRDGYLQISTDGTSWNDYYYLGSIQEIYIPIETSSANYITRENSAFNIDIKCTYVVNGTVIYYQIFSSSSK